MTVGTMGEGWSGGEEEVGCDWWMEGVESLKGEMGSIFLH